MTREVRADMPEGYDPSKAGRFSVKSMSVLDMVQMAAEEWAAFRRAPNPGTLSNVFTNIVFALDDLSGPNGIIAMMGLDLSPFRMAQGVFDDAQQSAQSGMLSSSITGGSAGRITLAMKDVRLAAKQMVMDSRDLRGPEKSISYMAFCADVAAVYNALALVAKLFRLNMRILLKAANLITAHSQVLSTQALATAPQPEAMVLASWVRRAALECHRNPTRAIAMVEGLLQSLQGR